MEQWRTAVLAGSNRLAVGSRVAQVRQIAVSR
jgi:hypothetical protein